MSDARRFRMKNGCAEADQRDRREHEAKRWRHRKQEQAAQRRGHAGCERKWAGMPVREKTNERLQDRSDELVCESDKADVPKIEGQGVFQQRINRRDKRLEGVVNQVGKTQRNKDA
jgi:hypothetical protein